MLVARGNGDDDGANPRSNRERSLPVVVALRACGDLSTARRGAARRCSGTSWYAAAQGSGVVLEETASGDGGASAMEKKKERGEKWQG